MLNVRTIDRLLVIEKYGSIAKAADELHVSRSALVQQIKQIEADVGFEIFSRDHKGVYVTEEGKYFLEENQILLRKYEQVLKQCRNSQDSEKERVVIGSIPNLKPILLSDICREFKQTHPNVKIEFRDFSPEEYFKEFQKGSFDICAEYMMNYYYPNTTDVLFTGLLETRFSCAVLPDHRLADRKIIHFEDLRGERLLIYQRGIARREDHLRDYILRNEPEIQLADIGSYDSMLHLKCDIEKSVLLTYARYEDSFSEFQIIPTDWEIPIILGIGCHRICRPVIQEFVKTAEQICR